MHQWISRNITIALATGLRPAKDDLDQLRHPTGECEGDDQYSGVIVDSDGCFRQAIGLGGALLSRALIS